MQITDKAPTQCRDSNRLYGPEKITKIYFTIIFRAVLYKEDAEKEQLKFEEGVHVA